MDHYKEKYIISLGVAKTFYESPNTTDEERETLKSIFPELRESEDEKIRKVLIKYFKCSVGIGVAIGGISKKDIIAYLEKQKEQKPIKVLYIPKFREGDMVVSTNNRRLTYRILNVGSLNELGNREYKVEIFTDGKPGILGKKHNIQYIEIEKMDEWGELIGQKPMEWSEEDERHRKGVLAYLSCIGKTSPYYEDYVWFKSIRSKPQGVFEQAIRGILKMCDDYQSRGDFAEDRARDFWGNVRVKCKDTIECAPFLDEPHLKPGKEQIEALERAIIRINGVDDIPLLTELRDLLKKL